MLRKKNCEREFGYTITHWFQPIYDVKNKNIIGHEALLRDISQLRNSPADIFRDAEINGYREILDSISIKAAVEAYKDEPNALFVNIFPSTLLSRNFLSWWDKNIEPQMNVVLELLENEPVGKWREVRAITKELQARDVKIAIDDMGEGYSFFQQWIELNPDYIKLDRYFADNLSTSPLKQKTVKSIVDLLAATTDIIIEGIETEADLKTAKQLGIPYAQGYMLGKPSPKEDIIEKNNSYIHKKY